MAEKIAVDLGKVEELAAQGLKRVKIAEGLGLKVTTYDSRRIQDPEFRAALDRGAARASSNGAGKIDRSAVAALDQDSREVLNAIETAGNAGISAGDIEIYCEMTGPRVGRALQVLQPAGLVYLRGARFHAGAWPNGSEAKAASSRRTPKAKANEDAGRDARAPQAAIQPASVVSGNTFSNLNGHTETARALEGARVELLYQRVHGEASPKAADVIERIETELTSLVRAAGAGA
jgi:hypothetical protein